MVISRKRGAEDESKIGQPASHENLPEIESLCLTAFIPDVDNELPRLVERVFPTHRACRDS